MAKFNKIHAIPLMPSTSLASEVHVCKTQNTVDKFLLQRNKEQQTITFVAFVVYASNVTKMKRVASSRRLLALVGTVAASA